MLSKRLLIIVYIIAVGFLSLFVVMRLVSAETPTSTPRAVDICFATHDNGITVQNSADASAIMQAIELATLDDTVKIAGTCVGVHTRTDPVQNLPMTQTVYIDIPVTLQGGHTPANWSAPPDSEQYPTVLDAAGQGRVISIRVGQAAPIIERGIGIKHLTIVNGVATTFYTEGDLTWGGGVASSSFQKVTVENTTFKDNQAEFGGGIFFVGPLLSISDSTFIDNVASRGGGGIFNVGDVDIYNSVFAENYGSGGGGAIAHDLGIMNIGNSTFRQNIADSGAAISNSSILSIDNSILVENKAEVRGGGAITSGDTLTVTNSTIANNVSLRRGGGGLSIYNGGDLADNRRPSAWLFNNTISNNSAEYGGGIHNNGAWLMLDHTTVVSNTAAVGAGIHLANTSREFPDATRTTLLTMRGSLVTGNQRRGLDGLDIEVGRFLGDIASSTQSDGYNIIGTLADTLVLSSTTDITNVITPQVTRLADYALPNESVPAGATLMHALLPGSLAIDIVPAADCPLFDQRGLVRPQGGLCDAGAFEVYLNRFKMYLPVVARLPK